MAILQIYNTFWKNYKVFFLSHVDLISAPFSEMEVTLKLNFLFFYFYFFWENAIEVV